MPLRRTPPTTSASPLQHYPSDPVLPTEKTEVEKIDLHSSSRHKRKHPDCCDVKAESFILKMESLFKDFKDQQEKKIDKIFSMFQEIQNQNMNIQTSIDFLSSKYDTLKDQIIKLQQERQTSNDYIQSLEQKLEHFERQSRSTSLEIRNIPSRKDETKDLLLDMFAKIVKTLDVAIERHEIRDIYRIRTKDYTNSIIIVDLNSALLKENIIKKYKLHNKIGSKLYTENLRMFETPKVPPKPIYISESLTTKMRRLFFLARDFAKVSNYRYRWVTNGKIYLRKIEGDPQMLIRTETDITNLKSGLKTVT